MKTFTRMLLGLAMVALFAAPATGQDDPFSRKWFWGAQAGASVQSTNRGRITAATVGGNWLITATRSALLVSYDRELFSTTVADVSGLEVQFSNARRLHGSLLALPKRWLFFGGGFTIHQVTDPVLTATNVFATPADAAVAQSLLNDATTKGFLTFTSGIQIPMGRAAILYASYQYMGGASNFIFTSDVHAISGGLRIALGSAFEDISTDGR